ncbi:MAG: hypothetical protein ABI852_17290 [Gemmatimonadaceae bacterium]
MPAESYASTDASRNGADSSQHPAPLRHRVSMFALWFGLTGGPAAWALQLLAAYALSAHTCYPRLVPLPVPEVGSTALDQWLLVIFIVAASVSFSSVITALQSWQLTFNESQGDTHVTLDVGDGRTRFMALGGLLISTLFLLAVLAQAVVVFVVPPC